MTYLELSLTHGAVKTVLERLILKVELDVILSRAVSDGDVKVDLDSALRNGSQFVRLAELNVVPEIIAEG